MSNTALLEREDQMEQDRRLGTPATPVPTALYDDIDQLMARVRDELGANSLTYRVLSGQTYTRESLYTTCRAEVDEQEAESALANAEDLRCEHAMAMRWEAV